MSVVRFLDHNTVEYCVDESSYNHSTILIVVGHVSKLISNLDENDKFLGTLRRLNHLASQQKAVNVDIHRRNKQNLEGTELYMKEEVERVFKSFVLEVRPFFKVPTLLELSDEDKFIKQNEILAAFVGFLLQILDSESAFWPNNQKHKYALLQIRLMYILTILGDTPFWFQDVNSNNLLVECEFVANESGCFIYSCVFASQEMRNENFDGGIEALLEKIHSFLNHKLKSHSFELSKPPDIATVRPTSLHPSFAVDSFIEDLKGLKGQFSLIIYGAKDPMKTLFGELSCIHTLLEELTCIQVELERIETPQVTRTTELKKIMTLIREVVYEAEYLINALVMGRIPSWYMMLRLPDIVHKVKLRVQDIKKIYNVQGININNSFSMQVSLEAVRNSKVEVESTVIGVEDTIAKVLADLFRRSELQTICIYGMGGIGKTTIAKELYNHSTVRNHFDLRAWCVVSQTYDRKELLCDILMSLFGDSVKDTELRFNEESLALDIYRGLVGRRYLIILDDVWNSETLNDLRRYFPDDRNGSRILFTSRIKATAPIDSIFHTPPLLSESQSCDLLLMKVFGQIPCPPELFGIAKGIASKCQGLPLAVVVVGGMMATLGKEESTWKNFEMNMGNMGSYSNVDQSMKVLELSYENLPDHLKPCFLYLGRFREDEEVLMGKVIPLWIGEGFVRNKNQRCLEHVAEEYIFDLINRSLLFVTERRSDGGIKACGIHDLVHEMCLRKAEEEKFLKHIYEYKTPSIYEQYAHLVVHTTERETFAALHCRSLTGYLSSSVYQVTQMPLLKVIDEFQVESLSSLYEIEKICSLVRLKYLSFSVRKFPVELCKLVNLVYFYLDAGCEVSVPSSILKMVNLRHVRITTEAVFENNGYDSLSTNNLKSLSYVLVRNVKESEILKRSPRLHKLKFVGDRSLFPDLSYLTELESLKMKFKRPPMGELTEGYFPSTIKKLSLYRTGLPWEKMIIVGCLPNLRVLKLLCCAFVGDQWETKEDDFQELRYLQLSDVSLKYWITGSEHFPNLECLVLELVMDLMEIPCEFGESECLRKIEVRHCGYEIERSAVKIEEVHKDYYGNDDFEVIITSDIKGSKGELVRHVEQEKIGDLNKDGSETSLEPADIVLESQSR